MKKILIIIIIGIFLISGIGTTSYGQEQHEYEKISFKFSRPNININEKYVSISLPEANSYLMKQNKPLLPKHTETLNFPFGTKIKNVVCIVKNINQIKIDKEINPTPIALTTGEQLEIINTDVNQELNEVYPNNWYAYKVGSGLNNNRRMIFVHIEIYPIRFNPVDGLIKWANQIEIQVDYELPTESLNFEDVYDLIVLAPSEFNEELQNLINHKNGRGLSSKLITLDEIYGGTYFPVLGRDEPEKIKYFVKNAIENWNTTNVLLVGSYYESSSDLKKFPIRKTHVYMSDSDNNEFVSDLYYADIYDSEGNFSNWDTNDNNIFGEFHENIPSKKDDVDIYPDVAIGRLTCIDENQVTTVVNKIIEYETNQAYTQDWFTDLVVVGGDSFIDDQYDPDVTLEGEVVNQRVIDILDGFIPEKIWVSEGKLSTKTNLNNALNAGAGFVDYSGHGNTNVWATHPANNDNVWLPTPSGGFFSSDIGNLKNGNKLPIVIVGACSVGKFNKNQNCFNWAFLANEDGGGIASFGATALGYAYIGRYVTQGLVEKIGIETFDAYKDGAITLGEMWVWAINSYIRNPGLDSDGDYKTVEEWHLFGDPSLAIGEESLPPEKPETPEGPNAGGINSKYTYTVSTTDPDGDKVYYLFDWGDDTFSEWLGPYFSGQKISADHQWTTEGNYEIRVKAKDIHGVQGTWSDTLPVSMPKNKQTNGLLFEVLMEKLLIFFPFFQFFQGFANGFIK